MNTKTIKFDLNKYKLYEKIKAKQGDTKSRFLLFQLLDGSIPFNLTNRSVRAYMVKPDGKEIFNDLIINNYSLGYCTLELTNQVLAVSGTVKIELMVTEEDKKLTSSVFELEVVKSINSEKSIVSTNEFTALLNGLASLSEYDNYKNSVKSMEINKADKAKVEEKFGEVYEQLDTKAPKDLATPTKEGLMAKEDKIKLNGIDENANNYEHPLTHSASIIEQDTTHRFVTDDNIAKWNGVKSLGVSGYYKLAGGMIIQWGTCTSGGDTLEIIGSTNWYHSRADATFPIQFPNACNILIATAVGSKYISCAEGGKTNKVATILLSTPLNSGSSHKVVNWIAIGY